MDQELRDKYEVVIGLEVHAQLKTKSKIQLTNLIDITFPEFSSCFNEDKNQLFLMLDILT